MPVRPKIFSLPAPPFQPNSKITNKSIFLILFRVSKINLDQFLPKHFYFVKARRLKFVSSVVSRCRLFSKSAVRNGSRQHARSSRSRYGPRRHEDEAAVHPPRHLRHLPGRAGISAGQASPISQRGGLPGGENTSSSFNSSQQ